MNILKKMRLLENQLETLEEPEDVHILDVRETTKELVNKICKTLNID